MVAIRIQKAASRRLDEIHRYSQRVWGPKQANDYISGLFDAFERIAAGAIISKPIPGRFDVSGFFVQYRRHIVYWRRLPNGDIGIVSVLHERMHQIGRLRDDFGL